MFNKIWKLNIPHKVKFFGWLLVRNKLTTNANYINSTITILPYVHYVIMLRKAFGHRFKDCHFAQELWKIDSNLPVISLFPSANDWLNSLEYIDKQDLSNLSKVVFIW